jgi:hypothetical protein
MTEKAEDKIPVVRIAIQRQIGDKTILNIETWVDAQSSAEFMNAFVDKLMRVGDRQIKKYELIDLHRYRKQQMVEYEALLDDLKCGEKNIEPKNIPGRKLPVLPASKDIIAVANLKQSIEKKRQFIKKLDTDIAEREQDTVSERSK